EAWWALEAGAGIEVHGVRQRIERKNGALVERLFGELDPPRTGALAGPFAFVGFGVPLGDRFGVVSEVQGAAIWVPLAGGGALRPTLSGRVGVEWWF
ncbi:hypothetical protein L6R52_44125, partial [Myxococcota bacterium]|nr:hypothetical protein [Myxococcota bacterium]